MLSRAFGYGSKLSADLAVQAFRRAFGTLVQYKKRALLDLSIQDTAAHRRCSRMLHQSHQLHGQPVPPDGFPQEHHPLLNNTSRETPSASNDTFCRTFNQRFATLRSIGECVNDYELMLLLKKKTVPICYVWCDPSPWMQITQGILMTINVNKMIKAGCVVKILMADWFAQMDPFITSTIGSDLSKIQTIGWYNIEVWKATGMNFDGVEVVQLSDVVSRNADEYWSLAMDIARKSDLSRIKSWLRVHASKDPRGGHGSIDPYMSREFTAAEIFFPCLQSAGILLQKADMWLLGLDQRGGHILARQYCKRMERENRPIAFFRNIVPNLLERLGFEGCDDPRWTIFMEDDENSAKIEKAFCPLKYAEDNPCLEYIKYIVVIVLFKKDVCAKVEKAFCPLKYAEGNPCLEYIKYIVLPWFGKFEVLRTEENGGIKTFLSMEELTADYESGALHPVDVKEGLVNAMNMILQPVHDHFRSSAEAKELIKAMEKFHTVRW